MGGTGSGVGEMAWPSVTTPGAPSPVAAGSACTATCLAGYASAALAFAGIGDEIIVSTIVTPRRGKAMDDAAVAIEKAHLYNRPVFTFEFARTTEDKIGVIEVDGLTGELIEKGKWFKECM